MPNLNALESNRNILIKNFRMKQKAYHDNIKIKKVLQQEQI